MEVGAGWLCWRSIARTGSCDTPLELLPSDIAFERFLALFAARLSLIDLLSLLLPTGRLGGSSSLELSECSELELVHDSEQACSALDCSALAWSVSAKCLARALAKTSTGRAPVENTP